MELARNQSPLPPLSSAVIDFPVGQSGLWGSKVRNHWLGNWRGLHPAAGQDSRGPGARVVPSTSKTKGYLSSAKKMTNWDKQRLHLEMKSTAEGEIEWRNDPIGIKQLNSKKDRPQFLAHGFQEDELAKSPPP